MTTSFAEDLPNIDWGALTPFASDPDVLGISILTTEPDAPTFAVIVRPVPLRPEYAALDGAEAIVLYEALYRKAGSVWPATFGSTTGTSVRSGPLGRYVSRLDLTRPPTVEHLGLPFLARHGVLPPEAADLLGRAVRDGQSIVVAGATGSGKSTLLQALMTEIPSTSRVALVEDTRELEVRMAPFEFDVVASVWSKDRSIASTVRSAVEQRPDWLVLGEARDWALSLVLGIGVPVLINLHAKDAPTALRRLVNLAASDDDRRSQDLATIERAVRSSFDLVVMMETCEDRQRRVAEIARVSSDGLESLYRR